MRWIVEEAPADQQFVPPTTQILDPSNKLTEADMETKSELGSSHFGKMLTASAPVYHSDHSWNAQVAARRRIQESEQ
jgi:hypothetical protein